jgi:hypothetical protein
MPKPTVRSRRPDRLDADLQELLSGVYLNLGSVATGEATATGNPDWHASSAKYTSSRPD